MKETNEIIDGLTEAAKVVKKSRDILKDGADATDIPATFELVKEQIALAPIYTAAVKDAEKAIEEIKNASKEDLVALFIKLVKAVEAVEQA